MYFAWVPRIAIAACFNSSVISNCGDEEVDAADRTCSVLGESEDGALIVVEMVISGTTELELVCFGGDEESEDGGVIVVEMAASGIVASITDDAIVDSIRSKTMDKCFNSG